MSACEWCSNTKKFRLFVHLFRLALVIKNRLLVGYRGAVVSAALSEQKAWLRVRSRRSATFTPSAHVRRQSLPVWPPTLNKIPLPLRFRYLAKHDRYCLVVHGDGVLRRGVEGEGT